MRRLTVPAENEDEDTAPPRRITSEPGARGTVRMTRMQGGADVTPEEKRRQAKEIARRLAGHADPSDDDESS
jgi:hypothetical protein